MVFGRQRSSAQATAPQPRHSSVLVRASTLSCKAAADASRPLMVHPMSAPIYSNGAPAQPSPLPPSIAEDGCEVVPQFFPGYSSSMPQSPSARLAQSRHSAAYASSQRRAGSIKLPPSPGSDAGPKRYSNGSSVSSTSTMSMHSQNLSHRASYYEVFAPPSKNGNGE
ncbi:hypothetical protein IWW38_004932 [Coemansia aciculifera]|uniref:Uncharacterized protein n=1 Tax=Coemansia aciculifera TaxID=417176 RepID=A0ACC1LXZ7_9FUNG|nr:hypothetical protein IWW38_004932 [Coemansia aciculifera]